MNNQSTDLDKNNFLQLNKFKEKTFVIKYGGSIMNDEKAQEAFIDDLLLLTSKGIKVVIIHGGGPEISKWLKKTGIETKFIKGLRVTDKSTMEIVEMVLSGNVNKKLSSRLSIKGLTAIGLSGKDSKLIKAKKKYVYDGNNKLDIGFVGEVECVNEKLLLKLLENNIIPVISPVGCDDNGNSYNINADYAASFISGALKAEKLLIMTDIDGVYIDINDPSSILKSITIDEIKEYIDSGIITGGMIPKLECCIDALNKGTNSVQLIDGRKEHNLLLNITTDSGTKIIAKRRDNLCQKIV
ncbi:N-acetylglutamate kinase [Clostridium sp. USBA 49]|uniref:acetylglutamate kinase n=1 Tax=Clostridium sp. USBA 49 TaxID=1881060 RepID=UPI00099AFA10|nr:acetylglutamate kinase [Clostridium sp. USBA 49]SKA86544.1 N-acetylglutamate kinase [Clostridium sp. USBA 49]